MDIEPAASSTTAPSRGDSTREALIATATAVFAESGYDGVSTRDIALAAQVNQALIGYHFGGKEGLYLAVFRQLAERLRQQIAPIALRIQAELGDLGPALDAAKRRERHLSLLLQLTDGMTDMLAQAQTASWAQLLVREQQRPGMAFELVYTEFMRPMLELLTTLVAQIRAVGRPTIARSTPTQADRLLVMTIIGQVMVFRVARAGLLRHLDWTAVSDAEVQQIKQQIRNNVTAMLAEGAR